MNRRIADKFLFNGPGVVYLRQVLTITLFVIWQFNMFKTYVLQQNLDYANMDYSDKYCGYVFVC